jgi:hypothetical protein
MGGMRSFDLTPEDANNASMVNPALSGTSLQCSDLSPLSKGATSRVDQCADKSARSKSKLIC